MPKLGQTLTRQHEELLQLVRDALHSRERSVPTKAEAALRDWMRAHDRAALDRADPKKHLVR